MKTFLQDAADAGARFVVGARAERILDERRPRDGRAGDRHERGRLDDDADRAARRPSWSPRGAIESPALLLRSGIGGPAAGKHLRLHPASLVGGVYEQPIEGWIGQIQSALSDQFKDCEGEHGLPDRGDHRRPAIVAMSLPVGGRRAATSETARAQAPPHRAVHLGRPRPRRGRGRDRRARPRGHALVASRDEVDARMFRAGDGRAGQAAPRRRARRRSSPSTSEPALDWREGEDFDAFLDADRARLAAGQRRRRLHARTRWARAGWAPIPRESVADGRGELHDTQGRLDRRRLGLPHRAGRQPDDLDHVARAPHGREHPHGRVGAARRARGRGRARAAQPPRTSASVKPS